MRTIKEEEVDLSEYRNFAEAYEEIERDRKISRRGVFKEENTFIVRIFNAE